MKKLDTIGLSQCQIGRIYKFVGRYNKDENYIMKYISTSLHTYNNSIRICGDMLHPFFKKSACIDIEYNQHIAFDVYELDETEAFAATL